MAGAAPLAIRARPGVRIARRRLVTACLLGLALFAIYWLWFRDSPLVAVQTVRVEGIGSSRDDQRLREALTSAGEEMTTLHVRAGELEDAAAAFPLVDSVSADPDFPSTLTVNVIRRQPVALIGSGSDAVAVDGQGVILRGLPAAELELPRLPLSGPPREDRLGGPILEQAAILGAAPPSLRRFVDESFNGSDGIGVVLDGGVELRFETAARAVVKWRAAAAVLSDPDLGPLDYVDLSVPERPAVGGAGYSPPPLG